MNRWVAWWLLLLDAPAWRRTGPAESVGRNVESHVVATTPGMSQVCAVLIGCRGWTLSSTNDWDEVGDPEYLLSLATETYNDSVRFRPRYERQPMITVKDEALLPCDHDHRQCLDSAANSERDEFSNWYVTIQLYDKHGRYAGFERRIIL